MLGYVFACSATLCDDDVSPVLEIDSLEVKMVRRKTLTDLQIARLKPREKRVTLPDPELRGHYVRITPAGAKSYCAVTRDPRGKQVWATIGSTDVYTIDEAREKAREAIKRIKEGYTPFEPPPIEPDSFKAVAENYIKRHVEKRKLRSRAEIERYLETDILPAWKDREFIGIRRGDVTKLLDDVEEASGPSQADHVLAIVRGIMNWFETRNDFVRQFPNWRKPIVWSFGRSKGTGARSTRQS